MWCITRTAISALTTRIIWFESLLNYHLKAWQAIYL